MEAMRESIPALRLFSTRFEPVHNGTDTVQVPYFPLDTNSAKDYVQANGYQLGGTSNIQTRPVTINKDKYIDLSFTDKEAARQPQLDQEHLIKMLGYNLAEQVFSDILSVVLAANFSNVYGPVAASSFFVDDIQDIDTICDDLKWPRSLRGMILNHAFEGNVLKDAKMHQDAYGPNNSIRDARLPTVSNFQIAATSHIPANGENLVGMAVHPASILVGFSPIPPQGKGRDIVDYATLTDPDGSGLTLEYKEWYNENFKRLDRVIEVNYGYAPGEADGLVRIVTTP
jgi:hypothetical protein